MGKISLSNIAEELAVKAGLSRESANNFVHAFVETIEKGLQADGVVKVKGLGTFKLQEVSDRDSVDVNTGERITIKGYRKVTFTPDSAMKEFVNRPFAHFEPTELNEGYPADDDFIAKEPIAGDSTMEEEVEAEDSIVAENPVVEEPAAASAVAEAPATSMVVEEPATELAVVEESMIEEPVIEEPVVPSSPTADYQSASEPVAEPAVVEDPKANEPAIPEQPAKPRRRRGGLWMFFIFMLLVAGVAVSYVEGWIPSMHVPQSADVISEQHDIQVKTNLKEELKAEWGEEPLVDVIQPQTEQNAATPVAVESAPQKASSETTSEVEIQQVEVAMPKVEPEAYVFVLTESLKAKIIKDITLADTTDYVIEGTLLTHKLKSGETIIQLSNKYYGDKRLWPYIVMHNQMKNFNSVAIGQEILIPILK